MASQRRHEDHKGTKSNYLGLVSSWASCLQCEARDKGTLDGCDATVPDNGLPSEKGRPVPWALWIHVVQTGEQQQDVTAAVNRPLPGAIHNRTIAQVGESYTPSHYRSSTEYRSVRCGELRDSEARASGWRANHRRCVMGSR